MSRRSARKNAFFLLFQMDFNEAAEFEQVKEIFFAEKEEPVEEGDKAFILSELTDFLSINKVIASETISPADLYNPAAICSFINLSKSLFNDISICIPFNRYFHYIKI